MNAEAQRVIDAVIPMLSGCETAVDGGAHIGVWSIALSGKVKRVVAYEPDKNSFEILKYGTVEKSNITKEQKVTVCEQCPAMILLIGRYKKPGKAEFR